MSGLVHLGAFACCVVAVTGYFRSPIRHPSNGHHSIHFPEGPHTNFLSDGMVRHYFVGIVEEDWNYAPNGNMVNDEPQADVRLLNDLNRIGRVYAKAIFREFTDETFSIQMPRPDWLGFVGPIMRAEVGDTILVHLRNMASNSGRDFTIHPHGIQYDKDSEGAIYDDNTFGPDKSDDGLPFGTTFTYTWVVKGDNFAPTEDDNNCLAWPYHSHRVSELDIATGLIGMLFTCKKGVLTRDGERTDVGQEFIFYMDVVDENVSWLINNNMDRCGNVATCTALHAANDADFVESNKMHSINGYSYGNLPALRVYAYEEVTIHLFTLYDGHQNFFISGHSLTMRNQRMNSVNFMMGSSVTVETFPINTGPWLLASHVTTHFIRGMSAYFEVFPARFRSGSPYYRNVPARWLNSNGRANKYKRRHRVYYIAAVKTVWDYSPSGLNTFFGGNLVDAGNKGQRFFMPADDRIGGKYMKALFFEYTDRSFSRRVLRSYRHDHLGFLGPVISGNVGDIIHVVFKNRADREYSFWPNGVTFVKSDEGFVYRDPNRSRMWSGPSADRSFSVNPSVVYLSYFSFQPVVHNWFIKGNAGLYTGKTAQPGQTVTYTFELTSPATAPTNEDAPCTVQAYQSAVDTLKDLESGLVGPLVICKGYHSTTRKYPRHRFRRGYYPTKREFFLFFLVTDENKSWYLQDNINTYAGNPAIVDPANQAFMISNRMHGINGRLFGNLEGLHMYQGDSIVWYVFALGEELDFHVINIHGTTFTKHGNTVVSKMLRPGSALTLKSKPTQIGKWAIICRPHVNGGMEALYSVAPRGIGHTPAFHSRRTRVYYIAAVELDWEYCNIKRDPIEETPFVNTNQNGYKFCVLSGDQFIGSVYKKAVYREYTDKSFTTQKQRRFDEQHLHLLGPFIRGEVGETIIVVFKNLASRAFSLHAQGVSYNKASEGAQYSDGPYALRDDSVEPGSVYVYQWHITEDSGPGSNDPNCVSFMYYSQTDIVKDVDSGLIGPLVTCRSGVLDSQNRRRDVDKEFALLFIIINENNSWFIQDNIDRFAPNQVGGADFTLSNVYFSVNGKIYFNVQGVIMNKFDLVSWHIMGWGGPTDTHPIHFHGQTMIHRDGSRTRIDVVEVGPTVSETTEMLADNPGKWIVHCHDALHVENGMSATFTVLPTTRYHFYFQ